MKLANLKNLHLSEADRKAQSIGKTLTQPSKSSLAEAKKPVKMDIPDENGMQQEMRDYAVEQLEKTHPHLHRKSKHYD